MASVTVVAKGSLLEGRIVSDGEVIVEAGAEVRAEVRARRVVVRGIIRGDVIAPEVRLEEGGRVYGGVKTPAAEAAVAAANAANSPKAARSPMTAAMAEELAEAVAMDTTQGITSALETDPGDLTGSTWPNSTDPGQPASPSRRVVAVRRGANRPEERVTGVPRKTEPGHGRG